VRSWPRLVRAWRRDSRGYPTPGLQRQHTPEWVQAGFRQSRHLVSVHLRDRLEDTVRPVPCPVLVLRGTHDLVSTEPWARDLATRAPDGRFVAVPGPHTFVWTHPAAWRSPVRELAARGCEDRPR
jgi:pimeloyl-ACP methyl ester carboxylesterase